MSLYSVCVYVCMHFMEGYPYVYPVAGAEASEPSADSDAEEGCEAVCTSPSQDHGPSGRVDNASPEEDLGVGREQPASALAGSVLRLSGKGVSAEQSECSPQLQFQGWFVLS